MRLFPAAVGGFLVGLLALAAPASAAPVSDQDMARVVAREVRAQMAAWGLVLPDGEIPFALVDGPTINKLSGHAAAGKNGCQIVGLTEKRALISVDRPTEREVSISILSGLSPEEFEATTAHELMHAWMFLDGQPDHAPQLEEGACHLMGYYVHLANGTPRARELREQMFRSKDPVYGEGLRRAIGYVQKFGFPAFVAMLRTSHDFPPAGARR